jgi:hypothetical protein
MLRCTAEQHRGRHYRKAGGYSCGLPSTLTLAQESLPRGWAANTNLFLLLFKLLLPL